MLAPVESSYSKFRSQLLSESWASAGRICSNGNNVLVSVLSLDLNKYTAYYQVSCSDQCTFLFILASTHVLDYKQKHYRHSFYLEQPTAFAISASRWLCCHSHVFSFSPKLSVNPCLGSWNLRVPLNSCSPFRSTQDSSVFDWNPR